MIAVLGAGGVGGLIAALLDRAGIAATVVAREPTAAVLSRHGLAVSSVRFGEFSARPRTVAHLEVDHDVLILATKAGGLEPALERISGEPALVLPLLNGLDHLAVLRERFGTRAVAGTIRVESDRPHAGVIRHTSNFLRIEMASADRDRGPAIDALATRLTAAGIDVAIGESEAQVLWSKLVRLNALATTTSASGLALGPILADPGWRPRFEAVLGEGVAVAAAEGATIDAGALMAQFIEDHPTLGSSMARDIAAGRPPELDAIAGAVLRAADRHAIAAPVLEELVEEIVGRAHLAPVRRPG
ncbi:MAG: 2-dehydropantoate 2-reductase [Solirubrobacteraceae bacterium]|jgi:2-dehydropantoate 2-reductase|nr:2-dehydropantoate 2-reductase [Solirubrobacteraceae bacterium]